jgi:hypothetical protein
MQQPKQAIKLEHISNQNQIPVSIRGSSKKARRINVQGMNDGVHYNFD